MRVTAEIRDKFSITRGYFTLEQMSMLKPVHFTALLKRDKANAHTRTHNAPAPQSQTPPAPPAASVKATATTIHPPPPANTKQKAAKRTRKQP